jgi:uncharacterized protein YdcH (DUF465 family)
MPDKSEEIRQTLAREDEEFRHWFEEHHQYEDRLAQLQQKPALTPAEEIEEKQLKKKKLWLKDQMAAKIRGYENSSSL